MKEAKVLVVVPAKDEEASIGRVLQEAKRAYPYVDVLVVDDGSKDGTVAIARRGGALVVSHGRNLGVAAAIQTGRVYALSHGYDFIVFCDADGQHDPSDIGKIVSPLVKRDADFVIGSREVGRYVGHESFLLRSARRFCSVVISLVARRRIRDVTSGFKGWSRDLAAHFASVYEASGKLHLSTTNDMEEILLASRKGARIIEVPATMYSRGGESEIYATRNLLRFFTVYPWDLIRTVWRNLW